MGIECGHGFNEESDALNARAVGQDGRMSDRIAGGGQFPLLGEVQQAGVNHLNYRVQFLNRRNGRGPRNIMSTIDMHAVSK